MLQSRDGWPAAWAEAGALAIKALVMADRWAEPRSVRAAVERDLRDLFERAPELATGTLAATALALARRIDNPKTSATAASMCGGRLLEALDHLTAAAAAPAQRESDGIDDLRARRALRLKGVAAAAD